MLHDERRKRVLLTRSDGKTAIHSTAAGITVAGPLRSTPCKCEADQMLSASHMGEPQASKTRALLSECREHSPATRQSTSPRSPTKPTHILLPNNTSLQTRATEENPNREIQLPILGVIWCSENRSSSRKIRKISFNRTSLTEPR